MMRMEIAITQAGFQTETLPKREGWWGPLTRSRPTGPYSVGYIDRRTLS